jgi:hypothetical protein
MFYLIDNTTKIIFGWSAKCGCCHIKNLFCYLTHNAIWNQSHVGSYNELPENIEDYTLIIIVRNPYERLISGYLEKYNHKKGTCRRLWKHGKITFSLFIDELIKKNYIMVDKHHFTPQTTEAFNKEKIKKNKNLIVYDIKNIDYDNLEKLYKKQIPQEIKNFRGNHTIKYEKKYEDKSPVYDLKMEEYFDYKVPTEMYYNMDLKEKINNFYISDFEFCKENNIEYNI